MKNLMIVVVISILIWGCKDNSKKDEPLSQPNVDKTLTEKENINVNKLDLTCYEYKTEGNNLKMEVTRIEGDAVTANLFFSYAEKVKNEGTFFGNMHGDKLIGTYTFMSEGVQSNRDVIFKVEADQIIEGFGELNEGGTTFKDITKITYSHKTPWMKTDCN